MRVCGTCKDELVMHYIDSHMFEPSIYPFDSLVLTLYWLCGYAPTRAIAAEWDVNNKLVHEHIGHCMDVLLSHFVPHHLSIYNTPSHYGTLQSGEHYYGAVD